jgi:structure-specific recognition protein 1
LQHDGSVLKLLNSFGKTVIDIPLQCVSSANLVDGREIVLEMHKYDESRTDECLMDIRFILGTDEAALQQAKETHDSILELANLRQFTGELVTSLADIKMVVPGPRGKFSLDLYKNFFKIKDKSGEFDKNVSYDDISYMFMLNKVAAGGLQRTFVIGLDPPIRKGSSMYANLVFLMDEEERISLFIEMPESERKELGLPKNCAGFASDVVVEVFEKLTGPSGKKIHSCNENSTFRKAWAAENPAEQDVDCFKASISSDIGSLYPLEKCLLFLEKPPTYIPIKEISTVSFKNPDVKIASSTSGFDLIVKKNNGQKTTFSQIAKSVKKVLHVTSFYEVHFFIFLKLMSVCTPAPHELDRVEENQA